MVIEVNATEMKQAHAVLTNAARAIELAGGFESTVAYAILTVKRKGAARAVPSLSWVVRDGAMRLADDGEESGPWTVQEVIAFCRSVL